MTGLLECSGLGTPIDAEDPKSTEVLRDWCWESNRRLLGQLKDCEQGERLLEIAKKDAELGRLSELRPIEVHT